MPACCSGCLHPITVQHPRRRAPYHRPCLHAIEYVCCQSHMLVCCQASMTSNTHADEHTYRRVRQSAFMYCNSRHSNLLYPLCNAVKVVCVLMLWCCFLFTAPCIELHTLQSTHCILHIVLCTLHSVHRFLLGNDEGALCADVLGVLLHGSLLCALRRVVPFFVDSKLRAISNLEPGAFVNCLL